MLELKMDQVEDEDLGIIDNPFDPARIDIDAKQPTVSNIMDRILHDELNLRPEFQRMGDLWSVKKQSRLIESLLLRIPLPAFYFDVEMAKDEEGVPCVRWTVIDGLQRLCAIRNFISPVPNKGQGLRLTDLEFLVRYEGKTFDEIPRPYQRIIEETQLTAYLIKPGTPPNVKFNIFKRVNTGGVPLNQQEVRHALNQGIASRYLEELAADQSFLVATQNKLNPKRMQDREFVNRFLAFYLQDVESYQDMDSYMDSALKIITRSSDSRRAEIRQIFSESMKTIGHLFGTNAFRRMDLDGTAKLNKALFEVFSVVIARLSTAERERLLSLPDVSRSYRRLFVPDGELAKLINTSTGQRLRVRGRYEVVSHFVSSLLSEAS